MLSLKFLEAGYPDKAVTDALSEEFSAGRLYILLGKNGSGKSTLLNTLGGWLPPRAGSVEIDGVNLAGLSPHQRAEKTGRIAADPRASGMSALRFVLLGSYARQKAFGPYSRQDYLAARQALKQMKIENLENRALDCLSSGERQKAAIAQVLVQNPSCLFLDEPSSSLDPHARYELMDLLQTLRSEHRVLMVVLHDLDLALRYADEILVLDGGGLAFRGTPDAFVQQKISEHIFQLAVRDWDPSTRTARFFPLTEQNPCERAAR